MHPVFFTDFSGACEVGHMLTGIRALNGPLLGMRAFGIFPPLAVVGLYVYICSGICSPLQQPEQQ